MPWSTDDIPASVKGKTVIITGANTGLGLESATQLATHGAHVILACRNREKGEAAVESILSKVRGSSEGESKGEEAANIVFEELDLSDFESIKAFVDRINAKYDQLHVLMNNAGVMMCPYGKTKQGYEMQFGTNHLGHFLLTKLLWPLLNKTDESRVVIVSSMAHRSGRMRWEDINWEKSYNAGRSYGQSKLANLLMVRELTQRSAQSGSKVLIVGAHPGGTATDLGRHFPSFVNKLFGWVAMSVEKGALSQILAATDSNVKSGDYYGPRGFTEMSGFPGLASWAPHAQSDEDAKRLWEISEEFIGEKFEL